MPAARADCWLKRVRPDPDIYLLSDRAVETVAGDERAAADQGELAPSRRIWIRIALAALTTLLLELPAHSQVLAHSEVQLPDVDARRIFLLLFLMLGPIKILVPFAAMTSGSDWGARCDLAWRSILFSLAIVVAAVAAGGIMLDSLQISLPALALVGAVILILVAFRTILKPQNTPASPNNTLPVYSLALTPLAFPVIVTPFGIAALIVIKQIAAVQEREAAFFLIIAVVLALDLLAMIFAEFIVKWASVPLYIFAVVIALIQAALGLQIALRSLAILNLLPREAL